MKNLFGWKRLFSLFVVAYVVFLILFLPAQYVMSFIKLPNNVTVSAVEGSIWSAHINQLSVDTATINNIDFSVQPLSVFSLDPAIDVSFGGRLFEGPEGKGIISGLLSTVKITDTNVQLPANDIAQQLPLPIPVLAAGMVSLSVQQFELGQPLCQQLSGLVKWKNPAVDAMEQRITVNDLSAKLSCDKGAITVVVNEKNDLGLSFTAYIRQLGQLSGNGYLKPGRQFPTVLRDALPLLGRPNANGQYRLQLP